MAISISHKVTPDVIAAILLSRTQEAKRRQEAGYKKAFDSRMVEIQAIASQLEKFLRQLVDPDRPYVVLFALQRMDVAGFQGPWEGAGSLYTTTGWEPKDCQALDGPARLLVEACPEGLEMLLVHEQRMDTTGIHKVVL